MMPFEGLHVLILGLGASGLAMARWCTRQGARVSVWDSREQPPQAQALAETCPLAERLGGPLQPEQLQGVHWLLKSPGLAPHDAGIAALLKAAQERAIRCGGELDLFVLALAGLKAETGYAPQLLAITGTNGKTTTTALTALLVERGGRSAMAAGNIGPTLLETLAQCLDAQTLPQVWVLELSSFQLADLSARAVAEGAFDPSAAVVLNLTQDHLDWHGDMAAYGAAKARIYGRQAVMVINRDDAAVRAMEPLPVAGKLPKGAPKPVPRQVLRYGLDAPQRPGDFGLVTENGMAWLVRALPADETLRRRKGDEDEEIHLQRLMPADALRLRGRHNAANALAALALATAIGCPLAPMLHGLREYTGEPHRVEFVARIGEVEAFDDTKGTNVGATVAALQGLGEERAPKKLVLILGGQGKGQDFSPLAGPVASHARAVALIGQDAPAIAAALAAAGVPMLHHSTLEEATRWCFTQAEPGDAVLLSPACASLDMFRNYVHRGEVFVQTVRGIASDRGEVHA
ncbi:MAG: UDP-N-acetylmuramoyl-L-alanine--D-glutamate ligase [Rubrivivax sp.]|nr:UDP-N-acetylmuramoyl-L-alanine--D-glutamate ligase [Rubrivivax sp.]